MAPRTPLPLAPDPCCSELARALPPTVVEDAARRFKALSDGTRLQLLHLAATAGRGEACVCDLTDAVGLSQPTVSHHLAILTRAGLLARERRGTWAWYTVTPDGIDVLRSIGTAAAVG